MLSSSSSLLLLLVIIVVVVFGFSSLFIVVFKFAAELANCIKSRAADACLLVQVLFEHGQRSVRNDNNNNNNNNNQ